MAEPTESGSAAFWRFAIDRYGREGVSERCLDLQDRLGADVCVALFCLWKGQAGSGISRAILTAIEEGEIGRWRREVVEPLRRARRAMSQCPAALDPESVEIDRSRVKQAELAAEKHEIAMLARVDVSPPASIGSVDERRRIALENLGTYLAELPATDDVSDGDPTSDLARLCVD